MPSEDEIEAARTPRGGFSRDQLEAWGVPWPPPSGWKANLIRQHRQAAPEKNTLPAPRGAGICPYCDLLVHERADAYPVDEGWSHAHCPQRGRKPGKSRKPHPRRPKAAEAGTRDEGRQVIEAKWPGRCDRCECWYPTGEFLVFDTQLASWVHDGCLP